jgi:phage gp46-like protein
MDVLISYSEPLLGGDIRIRSADLEGDDSLYTAVVISLFTDRRARADDPLPAGAGTDRRGWWGDLLSDDELDEIGSRLWLLGREKTVPEVLARAREYCAEALQWMIDDGLVDAVQIEVERQGLDRLAIGIGIKRPDGSAIDWTFDYLWEAL